MSTERKTYRTFVVERELATTRQVAWDTLHEMVLAGIGTYEADGDPLPHGLGAVLCFSLDGLDLTETVISFEPPWRRVYELSGAPVTLYQGTTAFVDQGDTCLSDGMDIRGSRRPTSTNCTTRARDSRGSWSARHARRPAVR